jgi:2-oxoglutarate dehydrogenase E2 component (dihydrolipoamide succinyltransferase)
MATEVVMPQMGESIAEGTITKWLVKVGDKVERDQPLFEISTDKVDAEIPSPASGVLTEILNQEGETVAVNKVVARIDGADAAAAAAPAAAAPAPAAETASAPAPEPAAPAAAPAPAPAAAAAPAPAAAPAAPAAPAPAAAAPAPAAAPSEGGATSEEDRLRKFSSPLVRNIASQEGIDISGISGTGAHGRVTKDDILSVVEAKKSGAATPAPAPATPAATPAAAPAAAVAPAAPTPPAQAPAPAQRPTGGFSVAAYGPNENVEIEPMSKIRQITAAHMVYSKATSAHVTTVFHVDFSKIAKLRARAKDGFFKKEATKLTYMPFIFKAVVNGLKMYKQVNASIDGTNIVYKKDINLGMAVDLGHGLIVPVIKKADQLSLVGLAKTANDLADRARTKKLKPEEASGGTFTITNPGVFGSLFGTPVINQPQVAILGVGAIEKRPIVITDEDGNDNLAIKTMCYLAITYDHRLVDGADADRFMLEVKRTIEEDAWGELEPYL